MSINANLQTLNIRKKKKKNDRLSFKKGKGYAYVSFLKKNRPDFLNILLLKI